MNYTSQYDDVRKAWMIRDSDGGIVATILDADRTRSETADTLRRALTPLSAEQETDRANSVLRAEYYTSCRDIARDILHDVASGEITDSDMLWNVVHENVDGSGWIIYTAQHLQVLRYSENDDTGFDEMGSDLLSGADSCGQVYQRLAFFAMRADVEEAIERGLDEHDPKDAAACALLDGWDRNDDETYPANRSTESIVHLMTNTNDSACGVARRDGTDTSCTDIAEVTCEECITEHEKAGEEFALDLSENRARIDAESSRLPVRAAIDQARARDGLPALETWIDVVEKLRALVVANQDLRKIADLALRGIAEGREEETIDNVEDTRKLLERFERVYARMYPPVAPITDRERVRASYLLAGQALRGVLSRSTLETLPVISQGQFANLHIDTGSVRVWLSRMTIGDGARFDRGVEVERLIDGVWTETITYDGGNV